MAIVNLQKAQIIKVGEDFVEVKHPDLSSNLRTFLTASIAAAGTAGTVKDNDGLADNDFLVFGYPGDSKSEEIDINGAVTRGTSITVTNTLKFGHEIDTPVTRVQERQIRIMGAATLTGSQTAVGGSPFSITWSKGSTRCKVTTTEYAYYFAEFYDASAVYGEQSDGALNTGLADNTVERMTLDALDLTNESINDNITRDYLIRQLNNWQDDITNRRDWSFEMVDEETITSTTNANKYALTGLTSTIKHPDSNKSVVVARFADLPLTWMDWHTYLDTQRNKKQTTVSSAITAADTSCTLTDTYEFAETGTIVVGADSATYTANAESTGILTGVPATGTGAFASSHSVGDIVWQGVSPGKPTKYTIYNGNLYCEIPVSSTEAGKKFKLSFYEKIDRLTDYTDVTSIPFYNIAQYYLASRIEYKKGNHTEGDKWFSLYENKVAQEVRKDDVPTIKKFVPENDMSSFQGKRYVTSESSKYN